MPRDDLPAAAAGIFCMYIYIYIIIYIYILYTMSRAQGAVRGEFCIIYIYILYLVPYLLRHSLLDIDTLLGVSV